MKVEEEDSDNSLLYRDQLPLPDPLTFLNAEQALKLLSFLSHHLACSNFINLKKYCSDSEESGSNIEFFNSDEEIMDRKIKETILNPSRNNMSFSLPKIVKTEANSKNNIEIDTDKRNDDICKDKFDELKKLLTEAHTAISNIASSQDNLSINKCDAIKENLLSPNEFNNDATERSSLVHTHGSISSLEVWSTPSVSRSNSGDEIRAGKYHKKPAPKVPTSECTENLEDMELQKALKATLVIKTGTLKSFTDSDDSQKSRRRKRNTTRAKDGYSKLLTIPKNIFHSAFHKNQDEKDGYNDSSSITSGCSGSRSRSSSTGSKPSASDDITLPTLNEKNTEKYILKNDRVKTEKDNDETLVLGLKNNMTEDAIIVRKSNEKKYVCLDNKNDIDSKEEENFVDEKKETEGAKISEDTRRYIAGLKIRQMSLSPTRGPRKTSNDEND